MPILTVTQLSNILSAKLRLDPKLKGCAVKGEISDIASDRSGHLYFRLRDLDSGIKCVMFSSNAQRLKFAPFDGMSVIAYGSVDIYQRDGGCELKVTQLMPDGAGAEYLALAKLKEKLSKLGIFSAPKKSIPAYPTEIAVVTSDTGAAFFDVKKIISRRYPIVSIKLYPTPVQGVGAPAGIVSALHEADKSGADLIILTRGGGSSEDLSAFNSGSVVMAVYGCEKPIISAVGHEIDWTLSDLAADLRAPTPSVAAELATPDITVMRRELDNLERMLRQSAEGRLKQFENVLNSYEYSLAAYSVRSKITLRQQELISISESLERQKNHRLKLCGMELVAIEDMLDSLNPKNVISRGYAIVYRDGELIPDYGRLTVNDSIRIVMRGGSVEAEVRKVGE